MSELTYDGQFISDDEGVIAKINHGYMTSEKHEQYARLFVAAPDIAAELARVRIERDGLLYLCELAAARLKNDIDWLRLYGPGPNRGLLNVYEWLQEAIAKAKEPS